MMRNYEFKKLFEDSTLLAQYITILPQTVIFVISGALGFWYGQRQKLAYYLTFIMRMLPQELRQMIVEMAKDEAMRAHPPSMPAAS